VPFGGFGGGFGGFGGFAGNEVPVNPPPQNFNFGSVNNNLGQLNGELTEHYCVVL
jgi:hypothetical protein